MLLCAVALTACEKNAVQDITGSLPGSRIKFFNFGVNTPAVNFYANDSKITAITSATGVEAVTGVSSGGVGSGGFYSAIEPGAYTFAGKISADMDKNLAVSRASATLADELAATLPSAETIGFDLNDDDAAVAAVTALAGRLPDWRCLVNSASVFDYDPVTALDPATNREAMQVNALAPARMSQAFLAHVRPWPSSSRRSK